MDYHNFSLRRTSELLIVFVFGILFACLVSSAGVSTPYWTDHPAVVSPGQSGEFEMYLQNMVGDQDLVFSLRYEQNDGSITSLEQTEYLVPAGRDDVAVKVRYSIPADAQVGQEYNVKIAFNTRSPGTEGGIETGIGIVRTIPFVVGEQSSLQFGEDRSSPAFSFAVYLIIALIVVALIVYFVMKRKK